MAWVILYFCIGGAIGGMVAVWLSAFFAKDGWQLWLSTGLTYPLIAGAAVAVVWPLLLLAYPVLAATGRAKHVKDWLDGFRRD